MISGYYCNECQGGGHYLRFLKTGALLATPRQSGYFHKHTRGKRSSPTNGVFWDTGTTFYESGARTIGSWGFVEIENAGSINAFFDFVVPVGEIQQSGIPCGNSSLGKATLINCPEYAHWYPATGYGLISGFCETCGRKLFQTS